MASHAAREASNVSAIRRSTCPLLFAPSEDVNSAVMRKPTSISRNSAAVNSWPLSVRAKRRSPCLSRRAWTDTYHSSKAFAEEAALLSGRNSTQSKLVQGSSSIMTNRAFRREALYGRA